MRLVTFGCSITYGTALQNPNTESWPCVLGNHYNCKVDNQGIPGASNLEILWNILQYDFQPDDVAVIMWTVGNRDFFEGKTQFGVWLESPVVNNWLSVHSEKDMMLRSWLNIDHANLHLTRLSIAHYNFAVDYRLLKKYKPQFINVKLNNARVDLYRFFNRAQDNSHPGSTAHQRIAKKIKEMIDIKK